jgi:protein-tyrosine phosphatase
MDNEFLKKNNITVIFNCTKDLAFNPEITHNYRVPVDDNLQKIEINNMRMWAPEIVFKICREYRSGHNILVHCYAGMQRSAAAVAMFLIATTGASSEQVIAFIRNKRAIAFFPGANFGESIHGFENDLQRSIIKQQ